MKHTVSLSAGGACVWPSSIWCEEQALLSSAPFLLSRDHGESLITRCFAYKQQTPEKLFVCIIKCYCKAGACFSSVLCITIKSWINPRWHTLELNALGVNELHRWYEKLSSFNITNANSNELDTWIECKKNVLHTSGRCLLALQLWQAGFIDGQEK